MAIGELQTFKARFFRALAHPVRIRILEILMRGGRTVQELQEALMLEQRLFRSNWLCCGTRVSSRHTRKDCPSDTRCATRWSVSYWTSHARSSVIISSARRDSSANCNGRPPKRNHGAERSSD